MKLLKVILVSNDTINYYEMIYCLLHCILVDKLAYLWDESKEDVITLTIPENCKEFKDYYDCLQEKIQQIAIMDELLTGQ